MNRTGFKASIVIALIILFQGCGKDNNSSTDPGNGNNPPGDDNSIENLVTINDFAFSPQSITVSVGDTVTWQNDHNVGHTVTSDSGSELDSPLLGQGETYRHIFNSAGSFPYHCTPHPFMTGVVLVQ